jgi:hypothetical protein
VGLRHGKCCYKNNLKVWTFKHLLALNKFENIHLFVIQVLKWWFYIYEVSQGFIFRSCYLVPLFVLVKDLQLEWFENSKIFTIWMFLPLNTSMHRMITFVIFNARYSIHAPIQNPFMVETC